MNVNIIVISAINAAQNVFLMAQNEYKTTVRSICQDPNNRG